MATTRTKCLDCGLADGNHEVTCAFWGDYANPTGPPCPECTGRGDLHEESCPLGACLLCTGHGKDHEESCLLYESGVQS